MTARFERGGNWKPKKLDIPEGTEVVLPNGTYETLSNGTHEMTIIVRGDYGVALEGVKGDIVTFGKVKKIPDRPRAFIYGNGASISWGEPGTPSYFRVTNLPKE